MRQPTGWPEFEARRRHLLALALERSLEATELETAAADRIIGPLTCRSSTGGTALLGTFAVAQLGLCANGLPHGQRRPARLNLARLQPRIEIAVERLLAVLDAMDGDLDFEEYTTYVSGQADVVCPDLEDDDGREIDLDAAYREACKQQRFARRLGDRVALNVMRSNGHRARRSKLLRCLPMANDVG